MSSLTTHTQELDATKPASASLAPDQYVSRPQQQQQQQMLPLSRPSQEQQFKQTSQEEGIEVGNYSPEECTITFLEEKFGIIVQKETIGIALKLYIELLKDHYGHFKTLSKNNQRIFASCIVDTLKEKLANIKFYCLRKNLNSCIELSDTSQVAQITYTILKSSNIRLLGVSILNVDHQKNDDTNILKEVSNQNRSSDDNDEVNEESFFQDLNKDGLDLSDVNEICKLLEG